MGKKLDLTNQKFGKLIVIKDSNKRDSSGCVIWECQCDCGNVTYASSGALRSGHKQSCGCKNKEQIQQVGQNNLIDITGQKFGKLTVIERDYTIKKDNRIFWKCQCDCGNIYIANGHSLRQGNLQSCGCLKSKGEEKIAFLLQTANINYEREKIFSDFSPYRFDFYVNNQYIIEYDGKQHFQNYSWGKEIHTLQETQERDKMKNKYCFQKNIPIIRIPYTHLNKLTLSDLLLETTSFIINQEELND